MYINLEQGELSFVTLYYLVDMFLHKKYLIIRYSVAAITSRFHRGNRGSTPRIGVHLFLFFFFFFWCCQV